MRICGRNAPISKAASHNCSMHPRTQPDRAIEERINVVQIQRLHFWTERPNADGRAREIAPLNWEGKAANFKWAAWFSVEANHDPGMKAEKPGSPNALKRCKLSRECSIILPSFMTALGTLL